MKTESTFPREEKLKSKKIIGKIFSEGHAAKAYPIRIQFIFHNIENIPTCQVGFSVPKRNFKSAVDRNRIKRQIKEVYRLNKSFLVERLLQKNKKISMMIIYSAPIKPKYSELERLVIKALGNIRV